MLVASACSSSGKSDTNADAGEGGEAGDVATGSGGKGSGSASSGGRPAIPPPPSVQSCSALAFTYAGEGCSKGCSSISCKCNPFSKSFAGCHPELGCVTGVDCAVVFSGGSRRMVGAMRWCSFKRQRAPVRLRIGRTTACTTTRLSPAISSRSSVSNLGTVLRPRSSPEPELPKAQPRRSIGPSKEHLHRDCQRRRPRCATDLERAGATHSASRFRHPRSATGKHGIPSLFVGCQNATIMVNGTTLRGRPSRNRWTRVAHPRCWRSPRPGSAPADPQRIPPPLLSST